MHTPVEMITMKDISRTGHLMAQFIARLEPDFIDQIRWED
jgi:tetrahedral aminopeptidase